jgi:hypothetical protein
MELSLNLVYFAQSIFTETDYNDVHEKKTCYFEFYG